MADAVGAFLIFRCNSFTLCSRSILSERSVVGVCYEVDMCMKNGGRQGIEYIPPLEARFGLRKSIRVAWGKTQPGHVLLQQLRHPHYLYCMYWETTWLDRRKTN